VGVGETGSGHREAVVAAECSLCKIRILRWVGIALSSAVAVEGVRRRSTDEERRAAPLSLETWSWHSVAAAAAAPKPRPAEMCLREAVVTPTRGVATRCRRVGPQLLETRAEMPDLLELGGVPVVEAARPKLVKTDKGPLAGTEEPASSLQ
jgi:hypothetical protein